MSTPDNNNDPDLSKSLDAAMGVDLPFSSKDTGNEPAGLQATPHAAPPVSAPTPPVSAPTPPVSAPAPPKTGSASHIVNVAAALSPKSHQPAAQQVVINDSFPYDVAFNIAFMGSGQGGARIASSFHDIGYRRVGLFNTAESDFQGLPEAIERHTLELGGAAKDARFAEAALNGHEEEIWDLLQRSWGNDMDYGIICVGLGTEVSGNLVAGYSFADEKWLDRP